MSVSTADTQLAADQESKSVDDDGGADRRSSCPSDPVKIGPSSAAGGKRRMCSERASRTSSGKGTVRTLLAVLGGPNVGAWPRIPTSWRVNSGAAAQEVHPVEGEAEDLALSESGARSEDDH